MKRNILFLALVLISILTVAQDMAISEKKPKIIAVLPKNENPVVIMSTDGALSVQRGPAEEVPLSSFLKSTEGKSVGAEWTPLLNNWLNVEKMNLQRQAGEIEMPIIGPGAPKGGGPTVPIPMPAPGR